MHPPKRSLPAGRLVMAMLAVFLSTATAMGAVPTEKVVYSFQGNPDGQGPAASLVADSAGNLYGTTEGGGVGYGTVFELSPPATAGGSWTEQVLATFQNNSIDGVFPSGTLTFDQQGNLYGTASQGGPNSTGTIFELSPPATAGGAWTRTILWSFPHNDLKGFWPFGKLEIDAAGNLYGTTQYGGAQDATCTCGVVFELVKPKTSGNSWNERVLYNFGAVAGDGVNPSPDLLLRGGMLYGTTLGGGPTNLGIVFRLSPHTGLWTETVLHSFTPSEGVSPRGRLIIDASGNLFGTLTSQGGCCGSIFELEPPASAGGSWQETTLYTFTGSRDGSTPYGPLWHDSLGNLFGTASDGGVNKNGTVYKLKAPAVSGGFWTFVLLRDFGGLAKGDGAHPTGGLILLNGAFYGTAKNGSVGGTSGNGIVFSITP